MIVKSSLVPMVAILCALLATCPGQSESQDAGRTQIQAARTSLDSFPFLVIIHNERGFNCIPCLGIKLNNVAVLATAKCLNYDTNVNGIRVGLDCSSPRECLSSRLVEEIVLEDSNEDHPERSPARFAILKLSAKLDSNGRDNANLMMGYYGHSRAPHYTVGFGRDPDSMELDMVEFWVRHSSGESLLIANNEQESVSNMGSPIMIQDEDKYKLVGIVSISGRTTIYRNLVNEFGEISKILETMSNPFEIQARPWPFQRPDGAIF